MVHSIISKFTIQGRILKKTLYLKLTYRAIQKPVFFRNAISSGNGIAIFSDLSETPLILTPAYYDLALAGEDCFYSLYQIIKSI